MELFLLCWAFNYYNAKGTTHDFKVLKDSNILSILEEKGIGGKFDSG